MEYSKKFIDILFFNKKTIVYSILLEEENIFLTNIKNTVRLYIYSFS